MTFDCHNTIASNHSNTIHSYSALPSLRQVVENSLKDRTEDYDELVSIYL